MMGMFMLVCGFFQVSGAQVEHWGSGRVFSFLLFFKMYFLRVGGWS